MIGQRIINIYTYVFVYIYHSTLFTNLNFFIDIFELYTIVNDDKK